MEEGFQTAFTYQKNSGFHEGGAIYLIHTVTFPQTENLPKEVENSSLAKNSFPML